MKNTGRTKYVGKEYFEYLQSICAGSFGPNGSIKGMRKQFYGKSFIVMCWGYGFRVSKAEFDKM